MPISIFICKFQVFCDRQTGASTDFRLSPFTPETAVQIRIDYKIHKILSRAAIVEHAMFMPASDSQRGTAVETIVATLLQLFQQAAPYPPPLTTVKSTTTEAPSVLYLNTTAATAKMAVTTGEAKTPA